MIPTRSQKLACLKIKSGIDVFVTGVAGTGKTFLLNNLAQLTGKKVFLTASTGAAALQLENGITISSFLGIGKYDEATATFKCRARCLLDNTIIVIDEISMIGKSQWAYIMKSIKKNSHDFRTVQIVVAGDPAQMPPIYWDEPLYEEIKSFTEIELKEIVRQKDKEFISKLMDIRYQGYTNHIQWLVQKSGNPEKIGVTLVSTRTVMNRMNSRIEKGTVELIYTPDTKDPDKPYQKLELWIGMKILIISNSRRRGYVNGDTGVILGFTGKDTVIVKLDRNGTKVYVSEVTQEYVLQVPYMKLSIEGGIRKRVRTMMDKIYSYRYMPLLPAYFLSVRRAQGSTLEYGCIHKSVVLKADIATQYTALSRFKSIENVYIETKKSAYITIS